MQDLNEMFAVPSPDKEPYTGPLMCAARCPMSGDDAPGGVILIGQGVDLQTRERRKIRIEMSPEDAIELASVLPMMIRAARERIIDGDTDED